MTYIIPYCSSEKKKKKQSPKELKTLADVTQLEEGELGL